MVVERNDRDPQGRRVSTHCCPSRLPPDIAIAHKTGSLNDTLNDAGIVFASDAPYAIAVMTTTCARRTSGVPSFIPFREWPIREELRLARWRQRYGATADQDVSPDTQYWGGDSPDGAPPPHSF